MLAAEVLALLDGVFGEEAPGQKPWDGEDGGLIKILEGRACKCGRSSGWCTQLGLPRRVRKTSLQLSPVGLFSVKMVETNSTWSEPYLFFHKQPKYELLDGVGFAGAGGMPPRPHEHPNQISRWSHGNPMAGGFPIRCAAGPRSSGRKAPAYFRKGIEGYLDPAPGSRSGDRQKLP